MGWTSLDPIDEREAKHWKETSTAIVPNYDGRQVRCMWWDKDPSEAPQGPRSIKQPAGEYSPAMHGLPRAGACKALSSAVRDLRLDVSAETEAQEYALRAEGVPEGERQTVSRVAVGVVARVDRLRAIGNGQVPQCAAYAWRVLMGLQPTP